MNRHFNLTALATDLAFALAAAFLAVIPYILTAWLDQFFRTMGMPLGRMPALVLILVMATLLLFANFITLRKHPSRYLPAFRQHGKQEMKILLQGSLFGLAIILTQIPSGAFNGELAFEGMFIIFSALFLVFQGAFYRQELGYDSQDINTQVMGYITSVLETSPRATQRVIEGYMYGGQIGKLIPREARSSIARMLMVQYFEQQHNHLQNTVIILDTFHDPENWRLVRAG